MILVVLLFIWYVVVVILGLMLRSINIGIMIGVSRVYFVFFELMKMLMIFVNKMMRVSVIGVGSLVVLIVLVFWMVKINFKLD